MMSDTTYMTGREAVEKGFADELIEDAEPLDVAASADGRRLFVRGRTIHLTAGMFAPDNIPTVDPEASAPAKTHTNPPAKTGRKGGSTPMASTVEELRAEYPELTAQLEAEARAAATPAPSAAAEGDGGADPAQVERQRIQDIDALASLYDAESIREAKYGDHPCTAQELAYRMAQKAAQTGKSYMTALEADTGASGAQQVGAANNEGVPAGELTPEQRMAKGRADAKALNKKEDK